MRKIFKFLTVFFILSLFFNIYGVQNKKNTDAKKNIKITILYTNDLHANVDPFLFRAIDEKEKVGGFANITAFVKDVKKNRDTVFFFDAGDYFTGPAVSTLTEGEAIVDIVDTMGYDAIAVGNHEFDHGWKNALEKLKKYKTPVVLANIFIEESGQPFWDKPYVIIEKNGIKLGVIGIHGKFAFYDTITANAIKGLEARDEEEYLRKYIAEIKDKVDLIVVLAHEGTPARQSSKGTEDVARALKKDIELAGNVKGIDILITGHAHQGTPEALVAGNTLIVSTDAQGTEVGELELVLDSKTKKILSHTNKLNIIYDKNITADPETQQVIDKWNKIVDEKTKEVVGKTDITLTRSYGSESLLGNLIGDAIFASAVSKGEKPDFAVTNSGGIRADIEKGDITQKDVISAFPFPNALTVLTLNGKDVISMFEHAAGLTNGVLQVSHGLIMEYDPKKEAGNRITKLELNGKKIDPNKKYRIATNDFLANGGDGFSQFLSGTERNDINGYMMYNAIMDYLRDKKTVSPKLEGRVTAK
ncbi:bifunctional UDP-sugar hydrolase/5'-nucleotidase [Sebaldella sp. S0638]|uniref:bifunctional metallophosphatase/5'-nucleotidase n=1 Tax=Sebaldella sp. S0638 TaxID=2957809 RepID=UPI00209CA7B5|nr:bifunctional UDP-sugar hydrolase/5'-nucleotidase [Sebaldella sp. S0638]MCP1226385.1 bifunctional metallophosphatase/5'-nucleotidase [Sebaldella sp. S0638]